MPSRTHDEDIEVDEAPTEIDPYAILSVEQNATADQIKSAYRKAALKHHPDKASPEDKDAAHTRFQEIAFAYAILSDERRRKRYDTTGNTSDSLDLEDDDFDWTSFFREQYKSAVTETSINKFADEYKGSEEEQRHVLDAYEKVKGNMEALYGRVMLSDMLDDEDRFRVIIDKAIEDGEVDEHKKYAEESEASRKKRMDRARKRKEKEEKEAQKAEAEMEEDPKSRNSKSKAKGGDADMDGLAALIQQRQQGRSAEGFIAGLEAKYANETKGGKGKKGTKRASSDDEPSEEAFAKNRAAGKDGDATPGARRTRPATPNMPRKVTHKAWAVYVNPVVLAEHLEAAAYEAHKAEVDTLLECALSASDRCPHITKLPHELVLDIKDLLCFERTEIRDAKKAQMCFKGTCSDGDHLPDDQIQALEEHLAKEYDIKSDDDDMYYHILEYLNDRSPQEMASDGFVTVDWHAIHNSNIHDYELLVGQPGSDSYGVFTRHHDFLLKRYGLQVWAQFKQFDECSYRAEAYLTLPSEVPIQSSVIPFNFKPCDGYSGHHLIGHRCDAETQEDKITEAPNPLTSAQYDTFARAIEALEVESEREYLSKGKALSGWKENGPGGWMEQGNNFLWRPKAPQYREMSHIYR
ncbi:hypothetical protein LTR15_005312 [Elasticomyces elasticus]|nr:hypothetical protein LTR15_005312 [Elasticomyces elasticus]